MSKCECYKLTLPRWDIMYCPYCNRQLAWITNRYYPCSFKYYKEKVKEFFNFKNKYTGDKI